MTLQAGIYGGVGRLGAARQGGATPWWLSGGIAASACVAAWQGKGVESIDASYINLANPGTYNLINNGGCTWNPVTGWAGGAYKKYLNTTVNFPIKFAIVRVNYINGGAKVAMSANQYNGGIEIYPQMWGGSTVKNRGSGASSTPVTNGVMAVSETNFYIDGVLKKSFAKGSTITNTPIFMLAVPNYDGDFPSSSDKILAAALYDFIPTDLQVATLTAAMAAL